MQGSAVRLRPQDIGLNLTREHYRASFENELPRFSTATGTLHQWRRFADSSPELRSLFQPVLSDLNRNLSNIHSPIEVNARVMSGVCNRFAEKLESKDPNTPLTTEDKNIIHKIDQQNKKMTQPTKDVGKGNTEKPSKTQHPIAKEFYEEFKKHQDIPDLFADSLDAVGIRGTLSKKARQAGKSYAAMALVTERWKKKFSPDAVQAYADQLEEKAVAVSDKANQQLASPDSKNNRIQIAASAQKEYDEFEKNAAAIGSVLQLFGKPRAAEALVKTVGGITSLARATTSILSGTVMGGPLGIGAAIGGAFLGFFSARIGEKRIIKSLKKHIDRQMERLKVGLKEQFNALHQENAILLKNMGVLHEQVQFVQENLLLHSQHVHKEFDAVHGRFDILEAMMGKIVHMVIMQFLNVENKFHPIHVDLESLLRLSNETLYNDYWKTKELTTQQYRKIETEIGLNTPVKKVREQWSHIKFWLTKEVTGRNIAGGPIAHLNQRDICMQITTLGIESTINTIASSLFFRSHVTLIPHPIDWARGVDTLVQLLESSPEFQLNPEDMRSMQEIISVGEEFKRYILEIRGNQPLCNKIFEDYKRSYHVVLRNYCQHLLGETTILSPIDFKQTIEKYMSDIDKQAASPAPTSDIHEKNTQRLMYSFLRGQLTRVFNECQQEVKPRDQAGWYRDLFEAISKKGIEFYYFPNNDKQATHESRVPALVWYLNLAGVSWEPVVASQTIVLDIQKAIIGRALHELLSRQEEIDLDALKMIHEYLKKQNPTYQVKQHNNPLMQEAIKEMDTALQKLAVLVKLGFMKELHESLEPSTNFGLLPSGTEFSLFVSKHSDEDPFNCIQDHAKDTLNHLHELKKHLEPQIQRYKGNNLPAKLLSYPLIDLAIEKIEEATGVVLESPGLSSRVLEAIRTFLKTGSLEEIDDREYLFEILNYATVHSMDALIAECSKQIKDLPGALGYTRAKL